VESKEQLVQFLDERVFDPILDASTDRYHGSERDELKYVQDRTRAEKQRYHGYETAEKVVQMFRDDLRSEAAKKVNAKLK
jgi:hypothetical protein